MLHILLPILIVTIGIYSRFAIHSVPEGYVGVYYRGGALLSDIAHPGIKIG